MENAFKSAEETYAGLKERFRRQEIARQEFLDAMKNLQVRDDQGRLWMIGNQSGQWYYLKGKEWVQDSPPVQKKESRQVCPYCGLENKPEALACARCGGNVRVAADVCPQCGSGLEAPLYRCPVCDVPESQSEEGRPAKSSKQGKTAKTPAAPAAVQPPGSGSSGTAGSVAPAPGASKEFLAQSLGAPSFFFFGGAMGIVVGIVLGAFAGSTRFLSALVSLLPAFLSDMQGTLLGAVVYAAAGGLAGFLALGLVFFLLAAFINLILSFVGGVKIRLETPRAGR
ncbi:MAG: hypothetical protein FJY83_05010 [Candidatus Aminicenantes bacterium]|nr:hypothetical protein [Candidatus Aminicenantes bacterium]